MEVLGKNGVTMSITNFIFIGLFFLQLNALLLVHLSTADLAENNQT